MDEKKHYFSFLLRLWLAGTGDQPQWHASLEDTRTGERFGFATPETLYVYLDQQTRFTDRPKEVLPED
jgi:hypothetical protein